MQHREILEGKTIRVWDPLVRIGHWVLVVAFFTAWLSGDEWLAGHLWAGYIIAGIVLLRIVWGFIGTRHARFSSFVYRPKEIRTYGKTMLAGKSKRYLGHNPLGGLMIVLMLVCLLMLSVSGVVLQALEENSGPLAGVVYPELTVGADGSVSANGDDEVHDDGHYNNDDDKRGQRSEAAGESGRFEQVEGFWEELHEILTNIMLLLVGLHIAGVALSSSRHRENLVRAMFTGRKPV
ncbi:MAG: cytochrome b/b6 domain-containing protein [Wenzhouxiangellaceae bacterium]|nr:cytochrome b/b6 domain-containing protein [Wenzhouxiangellaceae bacterium]